MHNPQTIVRSCSCKHEYQDHRYGAGQRLHNLCVKEGKATGTRCTVCAAKKA